MVIDTVRSRIELRQLSFTKSEQRIARAILSDYPLPGLKTLAELGKQTSASAATVLRFVGKLGYSGYPAFQTQLQVELQSTLDSPLSRFQFDENSDGVDAPLAQYAHFASKLMNESGAMVSEREFESVASLLADTRKMVHLIGGRFSHPLAELLGYGLANLRSNTRTLKIDTRAMVEALMEFSNRDLLVVFDYRRYDPSVLDFTREARDTGAKIIVFTDKWQSPCVDLADSVIAVPVVSPSVFDSALASLMCIEALVLRLSELLAATAPQRMIRSDDLYKQFNTQ